MLGETQMGTGEWGMLCGLEGRQLVLIGDQPCGPLSARKVLKAVPRRLLLDDERVARAMRARTAIDEVVALGEQNWRVRIEPLLSPRTSTAIGVLACVVEDGQAFPNKPLVGCWEWEIERNADGSPTLNRRSHWDRNLFRIYEVDPAIAQHELGYWEAGEWATRLIDQADQVRVNGSIRDGLADALNGVVDRVRCLTYRIVTGHGRAVEGRKHVRLVGTVPPIDDDAPMLYLQGCTYEAPEGFHDMAFDHDVNAARVDDVLRGIMELTREPIAVVDSATLEILTTSPTWRSESLGHVGGLGEIALDQTGRLRELIAEAARYPAEQRSMDVEIKRTDGRIDRAGVTVTGVRSMIPRNDAVVRIDL